ncbi:MAG: SusC/RagA family TonB-linked outer membrane protein, partial [Bacteroidales bacterium]
MRCITKLLGKHLKQMQSHKTFQVLRTVLILFMFQLFVMNVAAQPVTITGTITDAAGESIIGANVIIKGTTIGTISDVNGQFTMDIDDPTVALVISFVGYSTHEVVPGDQRILDIILSEDMVGLDEVVVVGYGTQKKVNLTGAVGTASGDVLEDRPIVNVGEGLKGVIPNFNIDIRNGDPADTRTDFNIRGYESINGGDPLILIDGVPGDLNSLNPNDIATVSILKDAAASAVYGARAAFGVVLVETKRGKGRKANVTLSAEFGWAKPIFLMDPMTDPYQFALQRNKATQRTSGSSSYDDLRLSEIKQWVDNPTAENLWTRRGDGVIRFNGYNNYQNELITDYAPQQKYDFNVSGASENASYYVSFGYLNKEGYLNNKDKNENYKRYNVLMKGDFKVNKWLSLDSRILMTSQKSDKPHFYHWDVNINTSARQDPLDPISFPDLDYYVNPGDHDEYADLIGRYFGGTSFFEYLERGGRETFAKTSTTLTQGLNLTPIKGLNIRADFSYILYTRNYQDVQSKVVVVDTKDLFSDNILTNGFSGNDWINNINNHEQYYAFNTYADYTIDQGSHFFKAMVGFNQEWGETQFNRSKAYSLITPQVPDLNATVGAQETYGGKEHFSLRGVFYRVNYIFKDRYLVEANGRYDGTSRFPKDDRFGFFPSFSAGWRLSEEAFLSGASGWLDNLKIRASYGTLGNQIIKDGDTQIYYPYIPTMGIGTSPIMFSAGQRSPYVTASGLVSPTLTWESVVNQNIGVDFTMFGNRLDFSFVIYARDTKDMLME